MSKERVLKQIAKEKREKTGSLSLSLFEMIKLPKEIIYLKHLKELHLQGDYIQDYSLLETLQQLNILSIRNNNGIKNYNFLAKKVNLSHLTLRKNQIKDIFFLEKLTNLNYLNLRENQVEDISLLSNLTNLNSLNLRSNNITDCTYLKDLENLNRLHLNYNQIKDISFLKRLISLNKLNLSNNQIENIYHLRELVNLTNLQLNNNRIKTVNSLKQLTKLTALNLHTNEIKDLHPLRKLTHLTNLIIRANEIEDINFLEEISNKNHLLRLDISTNKIRNVKPLLPLIKKGLPVKFNYSERGIFLKDNPLEHPPIEIVQQGNEAIIKYFEELEAQETVELQEAKLLIVGEGGVGKTSLLRKLINEKADLPEEEETTKGIDIQEYYFEIAGKNNFRINLWDFGGQEIYHATHQFFLTKRSLYVLVDDTRKDDKTVQDKTFNYWLQTIALFGGESPIVIIQNEKGDRSKTLDLKSIQGSFENVKGSYATNLLTCSNLAETKTALEFYIQQLPHIGTKLPKSWVEIRNKIEDLEQGGTYYISRKEYFEICEKHKVEEDTALILSQYFHDLGVFLHFQKDDILCKTVILQNEWATDAVYKVLDCESVKTAKGRFTRKDLKIIWGDEDCQEKYKRMHPELLALMKEFKLCYELEEEKDTFLAPQLFAESQPDYEWDESDNLIVKLKYGFMPKGLIAQFIVRMHRYVKDLETAWKNGVILERQTFEVSKTSKVYAEVVNLYAQAEIRIRVSGWENKRFLDIILEEFDKIHSLFEGIVVDKFIPCNCSRCKTQNWKGKYYFKYEVLKRAYLNNIQEIQCQENFQSINVHRLINETLIAKRMEDFSRISKESERMKIRQNHSGKGDNIGGNKTVNINHNYSNSPIEKADLFADETNRNPIDKEELRELLSDNEWSEVFDTLSEKALSEDLKNEILLLKKRWRTNKKEHRKGTKTEANFEAENLKVTETLLDWISEW